MRVADRDGSWGLVYYFKWRQGTKSGVVLEMGWLLYFLSTMLRYILHLLQKFKANLLLVSISKTFDNNDIDWVETYMPSYVYYLSAIF